MNLALTFLSVLAAGLSAIVYHSCADAPSFRACIFGGYNSGAGAETGRLTVTNFDFIDGRLNWSRYASIRGFQNAEDLVLVNLQDESGASPRIPQSLLVASNFISARELARLGRQTSYKRFKSGNGLFLLWLLKTGNECMNCERLLFGDCSRPGGLNGSWVCVNGFP